MASTPETVVDQLKAADFHGLTIPLRVGGAEFDFEAAFVGTGVSHDLVILATAGTSIQRLRRPMAGLGRALDQLASKRPVTLILLGQSPSLLERDELERYGRLLTAGNDDLSEADVRRAVAVLMPLVLPATQSADTDPIAEVKKTLGPSATFREHLNLVDAASGGVEAVRGYLKDYIEDVFDRDRDSQGRI